MYHNYNSPFYEFEVNARNCPVELTVNDMPCFENSEQGGMAVDWPVNPNILASGKQSFALKSRPFDGETYINKNASLALKIYVRDAHSNDKPRTLVFEMPTVDFSKKEVSQNYVFTGNFDALIPYQLEGWKSSVLLIDEDKEALLEEISAFYDELYVIFKERNFDKYLALTGERQKELFKSFYIENGLSEPQKARLIPKFKAPLQRFPFHDYTLSFCGSGRVVGVRLPAKPFGFGFYSSDENEGTVLEMALLHRKNKGDKLTLIR